MFSSKQRFQPGISNSPYFHHQRHTLSCCHTRTGEQIRFRQRSLGAFGAVFNPEKLWAKEEAFRERQNPHNKNTCWLLIGNSECTAAGHSFLLAASLSPAPQSWKFWNLRVRRFADFGWDVKQRSKGATRWLSQSREEKAPAAFPPIRPTKSSTGSSCWFLSDHSTPTESPRLLFLLLFKPQFMAQPWIHGHTANSHSLLSPQSVSPISTCRTFQTSVFSTLVAHLGGACDAIPHHQGRSHRLIACLSCTFSVAWLTFFFLIRLHFSFHSPPQTFQIVTR